MVYLDYNATTPLDERVLAEMMPYLQGIVGNASSVHRYGRLVRAAIDRAREQVAQLVNAQPTQIYFTSGGTEANNLAIKGYAATRLPGRFAYSAIEHSSIVESAEQLERGGWQCDVIAPDSEGRITPAAVRNIVRTDTALVSVMSANNETGVIQDIKGIAQELRQVGAVLHTDAVQAAGKIELDFQASGAQLMSLSAHKIYGPAGVGALVVDKRLELQPLLHGGGHEKGLRAGTENVAGIVGFGAAAELAQRELESRNQHLRALRDRLEACLHTLPGVVIFGEHAERVSNTVQIGVPGIDSEALLMQLDRYGIAVSSGSACSSDSTEPSHVLMAMGVNRELARSAIRISLGKDSTQEQVQNLCVTLDELIKQLSVNPVMTETQAGCAGGMKNK
jgi:cysteine desulfurase